MARELNGTELVSFIKERQAKQVRMIRQAHGIIPRLVILMSPNASGPSGVYVRMKHRYAEDIQIVVDIEVCESSEMKSRIEAYNIDDAVQGIIVQLPIDEPSLTDEIVNTITPEKDVDGLGDSAVYPSATADAINWLVAGYGVELAGKKIAVVGQGRLVGAPLTAMWRASGYDVNAVDINTDHIDDALKRADIIVAAAGSPRLIRSEVVKDCAVVVDAGTTTENGVLVGDVDDAVRERDDVMITPKKGGVGPLTVALLFDHLIQACLARITRS
jgi:methylenetetrahydrofolate dehydrogenase (NADP+)/methenyltetrahydrofolate cyclohydrolase